MSSMSQSRCHSSLFFCVHVNRLEPHSTLHAPLTWFCSRDVTRPNTSVPSRCQQSKNVIFYDTVGTSLMILLSVGYNKLLLMGQYKIYKCLSLHWRRTPTSWYTNTWKVATVIPSAPLSLLGKKYSIEPRMEVFSIWGRCKWCHRSFRMKGRNTKI